MKKLKTTIQKLLPVLLSVISTLSMAQNSSVLGNVIDENGEPFFGVSVIIQGTTTGTSTDFDGNYTIAELDSGTYTLLFTFLGYTDKRETINLILNDDYNLDMDMSEDAMLLNDVIVVGYGTKAKETFPLQ